MLLFDRVRQFRVVIASFTLLNYLGSSSPAWAAALAERRVDVHRAPDYALSSPSAAPMLAARQQQGQPNPAIRAAKPRDAARELSLPKGVPASRSVAPATPNVTLGLPDGGGSADSGSSTVSGQTLALPSGPATVGGS